MRKTILKGIFLLSVSLTFSLLSGCADTVKSEVYVTMKNNSSEETHLWITGESIDPANKLAPGASRSYGRPYLQEDLILGDMDEGVDVIVYAGRNGATLTSKTFNVKVKETRALNVVYSGSVLTSTK